MRSSRGLPERPPRAPRSQPPRQFLRMIDGYCRARLPTILSMVTTAALLDALYGLFEAEEASVFRFMRQGNPYLTRATAETQRDIERLPQASSLHTAQN